MNTTTRVTTEEAAAMVGKTYVEAHTYFDMGTGKTHAGPTKTFRIVAATPAAESYYDTCPDAERRVMVELRKVMPDGTLQREQNRPNYRWLTPEQAS